MKPPGNGRFADIFTANQESITSAPTLAHAEESHRSLSRGQKYTHQILICYRNTPSTDSSCRSPIFVSMCLQQLLLNSYVSAARLAAQSRSNSETTRPEVTLLVLLMLPSLLCVCYPLSKFLWSDILKRKPRRQVTSQGIYEPITVWENV